MSKIIKVKNLTHVYMKDTPFETKAIEDINLEIEEGEFFGLIGHTGSGKSTLIQHFNGLLKPTEGRVIIDGVDISKAKGEELKKIRSRVGLIFQYPEHQLFEETVYKDVAFGPTNMGLPPEEVDERVKEALHMVGIDFETVKDRSPFELSGGQMRRVAIAGVLAMKPKVLVLDEPTAGMDPKGRNEILERIKSLQRDLNLTIILVSHNMEDIAKLVDRIGVMYKGRLVLAGPPKYIFQQADTLKKLGLGVPQVTELMIQLKAKGRNVKTDIFTVKEAERELEKILRGNKHAKGY
jgi:energy-coupling factor transport system ATP-binding protein